MKPLHLMISAFGPFADRVDISFEKLGGQGLFLVSGDTGAGKTTIFDGICFVLFGETSGSNRGVDSVRSDFAAASVKTYVELVFLHQGKRYRIIRNPAYRRPKLRGEGMTSESADAAFYAEENDGKELLATGFTPVKSAVETLLGVDAKQFKQICMIAQGEFLKLLYADSTERGMIFRKVFHTDLYADFQKKLKEAEKEKRIDFENSENRLFQYLKQLTGEQPEKEELYRIEEIIAEQENLLVNQQEELKHLEQKESLLEQELYGMHQDIAEGRETNRLLEEAEKVQREVFLYMEKEPARQKEKAFLQRQRTALDHIKPLEQEWDSASAQYHQWQKSFEQYTERCKETEKALLDARRKKDVLAEQAHVRNEQRILLHKLQEDKKRYMEKEALSADIEKLSGEHTVLKQRISDLKDMQAADMATLEKWQKVIFENEALQTEIKLQEQTFLIQRERLADMDSLLQKKAEIDKKETEQREWIQRYLKAEKVWQNAKVEAEAAETMFLREQAGFLAEGLEEGVPCPVCGSLHHPEKAVLTGNVPTEDEWKRKKSVLSESIQKLHKASEDARAAKEQSILLKTAFQKECEKMELQGEMIAETRNSVAEECRSLKKELDELRKKAETVAALLPQKTALEQKIAETQSTIAASESKQAEIVAALQCKQGEYTLLQKQLQNRTALEIEKQCQDLQQKLYAAEKAEQEVIEVWQAAREEKERFQTLRKQAEEMTAGCEQTMRKAEKLFLDGLKKFAFADLEQYQAVLTERTALEQAEKDNRQFFSDLILMQQKADTLMHQCKGRQRKELGKLEEQKQEIQTKKDFLKENIDQLKQKIILRETLLKDTKTELKSRQDLIRSYLPIMELSKTANGELNGREKIAFEQFVQGFYFQKILQAANLRLKGMTENRYILMHAENAANKRSQAGLEIEVFDHYTGKKRSVRSLSGGEAFKASLCLALGLSDVIQAHAGGIRIDAMFIDEGFGSLDEHSREQAVAVLQKLSYGDRLVGIISHVSELKESIDKKIIVKKSSAGSSIELKL